MHFPPLFPHSIMYRHLLGLVGLLASMTAAKVTVYGPLGQTTIAPTATGSASGTDSTASTTTSFVTTHGPPQYTGLAAYNPVYMLPPAIPNDPAPSTAITITVPNSATLMNGLSIPQKPTFFGFSIEMSVATQLSELILTFLSVRRLILSFLFSRQELVSAARACSWSSPA